MDWGRIAEDLAGHGCATIPGLLPAAECKSLAGHYSEDALFRSRVVMARHGYGRGEYKYFAYPLPKTVAALRSSFYPPLAETLTGSSVVGTTQAPDPGFPVTRGDARRNRTTWAPVVAPA